MSLKSIILILLDHRRLNFFLFFIFSIKIYWFTSLHKKFQCLNLGIIWLLQSCLDQATFWCCNYWCNILKICFLLSLHSSSYLLLSFFAQALYMQKDSSLNYLNNWNFFFIIWCGVIRKEYFHIMMDFKSLRIIESKVIFN